MEDIRKRFAIIEDPRHQGYVEHKLVDVLMLVMSAVLCGLDSLGNIMIFAENNHVLLKESLRIEKSPSKATLACILSMVDGDKVGAVIVDLMRERFGTAGEIVAVDGKAIRSTAKEGSPRSALHIHHKQRSHIGTGDNPRKNKRNSNIPTNAGCIRYYSETT